MFGIFCTSHIDCRDVPKGTPVSLIPKNLIEWDDSRQNRLFIFLDLAYDTYYEIISISSTLFSVSSRTHQPASALLELSVNLIYLKFSIQLTLQGRRHLLASVPQTTRNS